MNAQLEEYDIIINKKEVKKFQIFLKLLLPNRKKSENYSSKIKNWMEHSTSISKP